MHACTWRKGEMLPENRLYDMLLFLVALPWLIRLEKTSHIHRGYQCSFGTDRPFRYCPTSRPNLLLDDDHRMGR